MNYSPRTPLPVVLRRATLFALACAVFFPFFQLSAAMTSSPTELQPLADKLPNLPLTGKFEKVTGEGGPYVLKLKNTSSSSLTVSAKILLSVSFHAESKARMVPEHVIEAGQIWTISELAADDKVIVMAKDYAPLQLTVP